MINLAICDDNKEYLDEVALIAAGYFKSINTPCSIRKYMRPQTLLADSLGIRFDLMILDIIMPGMTGMELARELRGKNVDAEIIFVTSNSEYALESFDVFPLTFITKPIDGEKLAKALGIFTKKHDISPSLEVKNDLGEKVSIRTDSIAYIKSQGHTVIYYLDDGETISSSSENFTTACDKMPGFFYRCHRCYSVNMKKVFSIDRYEFTLEDKTKIPISKNDYLEAKRRFTLNY